MKLRCDIALSDVIVHVIVWTIVAVFTLGFALFLFPYSFAETVINRTRLVDEHGNTIGRLRCTIGITGHIGHALLWWFLSFCTCGIAGLFYVYDVVRKLLSATIVDRGAA